MSLPPAASPHQALLGAHLGRVSGVAETSAHTPACHPSQEDPSSDPRFGIIFNESLATQDYYIYTRHFEIFHLHLSIANLCPGFLSPSCL